MSTKSYFFFYPSRRLGISSRFSVYIIAVGVYHQPKAVFPAAWWDTLLRNDDIPQQVADDIQGFALIDCQKYDIMFLKRGDPFENSRCEKRMVKTILGSIQKTLLPKLQRITYNNQSIKDSQFKIRRSKKLWFFSRWFLFCYGKHQIYLDRISVWCL